MWATIVGLVCAVSIAAAHRSTAPASASAASATPRSVIVVGDSITALNISSDERALKTRGIASWQLDAQSGRSSVQDFPTTYGVLQSGLNAIVQLKANGRSAPLWIIELGTNDANGLASCGCNQTAVVRSRIATITNAIGHGVTIGWVTVRNGSHPAASRAWNSALAAAAAADPHMFLIDWYAASNQHEGWFLDGIHPGQLGALALAEMIAAAAAAHRPSSTPPPTSLVALVGAAGALEPAVRLPVGAAAGGGLTIADRCGSISAQVGPGSSGAAVRSVQCALQLIDRYHGPFNGIFDAATARAVSDFRQHLAIGPGTTVTMRAGHGLGIWNY